MSRKPSLVLASAPVSIEDRYGTFSSAANTQPSFGLASLAASALKAGAQTSIIEAASMNLTIPQALSKVMGLRPDILGISATTIGIQAAAELAAEVKAQSPGTLTIVGGCHVSAIPEETMNEFSAFDIGVAGEGEETLAEIICRIREKREKPSDIPGTYARTGDSIRKNPPREPVSDLDSLPMPAWNLIEGFPKAFRPSPSRILKWPCASVVMTRGCPNSCTFCDRSVFGRKCRSYSPGYAADMCEDLMHNYGVRELLIEDDTFVISRTNVARFCEELLRRNLRLSWSCLGRADRIDAELAALMRRAGCWNISFGIESGDEEILKAVHKNLNIAQIRGALEACRQAGIRTKGFFMVGFPGESGASVAKTVRLVRTLPLDDISVMHLTPFPGSELYASAGRAGCFERNWREMNALTPVFIPEGMTRASLETARNQILKAFYTRTDVLFGHALHALKNPRLFPCYAAGAVSLMNTISRRSHE